jgi:cell shape-determining protein MreC
MKTTRLEKDLELEQEVTKKRHEEINSLLRENTKYKNELDEIRKTFGDMREIETRIKVASLKEEKINGLLSNLDQIMVISITQRLRNLLRAT